MCFHSKDRKRFDLKKNVDVHGLCMRIDRVECTIVGSAKPEVSTKRCELHKILSKDRS